MQQDNQGLYPYQTDEIDLRKLFNSLLARKFLIFGLTSFITLIAIIYVLSMTPTYKGVSTFTKPSDNSIVNINTLGLTKETNESVFADFLTEISSHEFQKEIFLDGGYLTLLNPENNPIDDIDLFINGALKSLKLNTPKVTAKELALGFLIEIPYSVSMEGANAEFIARYLNELVAATNDKVINNLVSESKQRVEIRLKEILLNRKLLLHEAKQTRLNEMVVLNDTAAIAKSLGIIENNFNQIGDKNITSNLIIAIGENQTLPDWYLYGEKALLERVNVLNARESDEAFIPELVDLDTEKIKLESISVDLPSFNSMKINQLALTPRIPIKPNKGMIVMLAFIGGFMMSILLALAIGALKPDEERSS